MSQKNETLVLVVSFVLTATLLGVTGWWLKNNFLSNPNNSNINQPNKNLNTNLNELISFGNKLLITDNITPQKQAGINAIANEDYQEAVKQFQFSLKLNPNDPETLIYLNNARIGNNKSYAIAVAVPIDSDSDGSQEILRGIAQSQNNINKNGGINNIPLKIFIANDSNNPEIAKNLAQEFSKNSEILGVVGHWASDVSIATAPIYESNKLVAISPISTSVELSSLGNYIYRTVPSDRFAGSALSRYQINTLKKQKTAIFFNSQSNYSKSLKDEFTSALLADGGEIVTEIDFAKPNFNAGKDVPNAIIQGAEVLMLATNTSTLDQTLQVIQVNKGKLSLLAGDDAYTNKILQIGGKDGEGMIVAIPWHILAHANTPFVKDSRQLWAGADVNWRTVTAYDATMALIEAIKINPTRSGIQETLSQSNFMAEGSTSPVRFLPSGDRNQAVQLVRISKINNPNFPYQFVPVK
jgi:branched-chain amino acid transport system substrate-binding protein